MPPGLLVALRGVGEKPGSLALWLRHESHHNVGLHDESIWGQKGERFFVGGRTGRSPRDSGLGVELREEPAHGLEELVLADGEQAWCQLSYQAIARDNIDRSVNAARKIKGHFAFTRLSSSGTIRQEGAMQAIPLSAKAVAALRFRIKGWRFPIRERDRDAFRELVEAGIMEPDGEDFQFTADGWTHREELLAEAHDRIEQERFEPPDAGNLSEAAKELLRTCSAGSFPEGDETSRPAYRELVKARIMMPMGSFTKGDECVFGFTYWGYRLRFEILGGANSET
jgi:hypothetical protein